MWIGFDGEPWSVLERSCCIQVVMVNTGFLLIFLVHCHTGFSFVVQQFDYLIYAFMANVENY